MRSIHLLLIALAVSRFAAAQSFDCKLAKSPREHAVCSQEKLGELDSAVSVAYKSLRAQLSPESAALVQSDQREWLRWLDVICPAHGNGIASDMGRCLSQEYTNRERDLKQFVTIGGMLVFVRSHFLYKAGRSNGELLADNDPGFGYGTLRWPQIDIPRARPNPAYTKWNTAVKNRMAELGVGINPEDQKNATFDTAVDDSGTIDAFYTIEGVNGRFIDVSLFDSTYGWGAAHPLTGKSSFLWWLDRNRELTISDIFIPRSDWKAKLTVLAVSNLRAQPDFQDTSDDLEKTVKEAVSDITAWTLTRDGLTITFGQYAIGPYSAGMPEAHIRWGDLKSSLTPDFQPMLLPAPAKP